MKKKHNITYFKSFNFDLLDKELPINLRELQGVIDRIAEKFPMFKKQDISLISRVLMEEIRSQLVQGNKINIRELFHGMKLYTFAQMRKDKLTCKTRIQVNTPKKIKS